MSATYIPPSGGSMSGAAIVTAIDTELGSADWQTGGAEELDYEAVANSTGNFTVTPAAGVKHHKVKTTITGTASTRIAILATTNRVAGDIIEFDFVLPDTAAIVLELRNATSGGTLIYTRTTTATEASDGYHWRVSVRYAGSEWEPAGEIYPSS